MDAPRTPETLGRSLALDDGDLVLASGDLALVSGEDNLLQGIATMIATPFASDLFNVTYGFDLANALLQPQSRTLVKELIRLNIVRSLALDNRIQEVREVVFDDDPRFFELVPQASPEASRQAHKSERRWRAAVVVVTVRTGELTLELEGPRI